MDRINERRWLVLIFVFYVLLAVGYSLLMPVWEAPDEPAHYHIVWRLARFGKAPTPDANYEAHQPRTYYYVASWVIRALDQVDKRYSAYYLVPEFKYNLRTPVRRYYWTEENYRFLPGIHVLRWMNVLFGGLALWLNWKTFGSIAPGQPALRLSALALAALTPQYLHIMSSVSNDALGTLAGASLFYLAIWMVTASSNAWAWLPVPLALILPLTTKLTVLPAGVAFLVSTALQKGIGTVRRKWLLIAALAGLFLFVLFDLIFPEAFQFAISEIEWRLFSFRKNAFTAEYLKFILPQIVWTYWGKVGWLAVGLPRGLVALLTLAGATGASISAYKLMKMKLNSPQSAVWIVTWLFALFTVAAVLRNGLTTNAAQGRLLFPAIGALSLLMIHGWHEVLPERLRRGLPLIVILLMVSCTIVLWWTGVLPVYYQPWWD